jgi:ATP-dependent DNA ligase
MVIRDGARVRLFSRNGNDWSGRYPWIVEAALKNNHDQFVIDGEAVVLGVDGIADFNALHSRTMPRSSSTPSTSSHSMVRTCAACRCRCGRARLLARRPDGIFIAPFEQGEIVLP